MRLNVVGLALDDRRDRQAIARLAKVGRGTYFDAGDAAELEAAMALAVSAPFRVLDAGGTIVAESTVGGAAVSLAEGTYSVVVLTDPEVRFDEVFVKSGAALELVMPGEAEAPPGG